MSVISYLAFWRARATVEEPPGYDGLIPPCSPIRWWVHCLALIPTFSVIPSILFFFHRLFADKENPIYPLSFLWIMPPQPSFKNECANCILFDLRHPTLPPRDTCWKSPSMIWLCLPSFPGTAVISNQAASQDVTLIFGKFLSTILELVTKNADAPNLRQSSKIKVVPEIAYGHENTWPLCPWTNPSSFPPGCVPPFISLALEPLPMKKFFSLPLLLSQYDAYFLRPPWQFRDPCRKNFRIFPFLYIRFSLLPIIHRAGFPWALPPHSLSFSTIRLPYNPERNHVNFPTFPQHTKRVFW